MKKCLCSIGLSSVDILVSHKFPLAIAQLKMPLLYQVSMAVTICRTFLLGMVVVGSCALAVNMIEALALTVF